MNPFLRYGPALSFALISTNLVACLGGGQNPQQPTDSPEIESPAKEPAAKKWSMEDYLESKEFQALSEKAAFISCGERDVMGSDGKITKDIIKYKPDVINFELAHTPSMVEELGFDKVTNCAQAAKYASVLEKTRYGVATQDFAQESNDFALAKTAVRGGTDTIGKVGVVQIHGSNGGSCTGMMLNHRIIVTSAHCLDDYLNGGTSGNALFGVSYFDPALGKRPINAFVNGAYDRMEIRIAPTFRGDLDTESDVGFIMSATPWEETTYYDYLKVYTGSMGNARYATIWGAGINAFAGTGSGVLRYGNIYVDYYGEHHIIDDAGSIRICKGDSGGPWIRTAGASIFSPDLVLALTSNFEGGNVCAETGRKQRATRMSTKIDWIATASGSTCTSQTTSGGLPYKECW
jgi:hypothetical protein